jgi:hypothetical protein
MSYMQCPERSLAVAEPDPCSTPVPASLVFKPFLAEAVELRPPFEPPRVAPIRVFKPFLGSSAVSLLGWKETRAGFFQARFSVPGVEFDPLSTSSTAAIPVFKPFPGLAVSKDCRAGWVAPLDSVIDG